MFYFTFIICRKFVLKKFVSHKILSIIVVYQRIINRQKFVGKIIIDKIYQQILFPDDYQWIYSLVTIEGQYQLVMRWLWYGLSSCYAYLVVLSSSSATELLHRMHIHNFITVLLHSPSCL